MSAERELLRMEVKGFALDEVSKSPILLLHPTGEEAVMPIWIGPSEASAIALSLSGAEYERPLTHDLLARLLDGLGARHLRTVVTGLEGSTFQASMLLKERGDYLSVDCRPSDGIAVALRTGAEIFVERELFESQKQRLRPREEDEGEEPPDDPDEDA
jgi:uncharacterized protein